MRDIIWIKTEDQEIVSKNVFTHTLTIRGIIISSAKRQGIKKEKVLGLSLFFSIIN